MVIPPIIVDHRVGCPGGVEQARVVTLGRNSRVEHEVLGHLQTMVLDRARDRHVAEAVRRDHLDLARQGRDGSAQTLRGLESMANIRVVVWRAITRTSNPMLALVAVPRNGREPGVHAGLVSVFRRQQAQCSSQIEPNDHEIQQV